ncbi:hypothetical protein GVAV_002010 [Gurleya vavrai]
MDKRVENIIKKDHSKNVLYLMQRDHRIQNNYSSLLANNLSLKSQTQFFIGCNPSKIKKNENQHAFMIEGLKELEKEALDLNIEFYMISDLKKFMNDFEIDCVVTEYSPLREHIFYCDEIKMICEEMNAAFYVCDSHNIVPCRLLDSYCKSPRGVKIRLYKHWPKYFIDQDEIKKHPFNSIKENNQINKTLEDDKFNNKLGDNVKNKIDKIEDREIKKIKLEDIENKNSKIKLSFVYQKLKDYKYESKNNSRFKGGISNGYKTLDDFIKNKFKNYKAGRNLADNNFVSDLSPWIHSGQLGTADILRRVKKNCKEDNENFICFVNELFAWRETAEHFCMHEKNYDNIKGALEWARKTLKDHAKDKREHLYSYEELEMAKTSDDQWNAGQKEMVVEGKMHGYVRMYWAKRFLAWTESPEKAIEYACKLNDKYEIDGNDPGSYLGVMWSICGSMDQGWAEREIFGKIRGMKGIKAKGYTAKWKKISLPYNRL